MVKKFDFVLKFVDREFKKGLAGWFLLKFLMWLQLDVDSLQLSKGSFGLGVQNGSLIGGRWNWLSPMTFTGTI